MPRVEACAQFRLGRLFFNRFESVVYERFPELRKLYDTLGEEPFLRVLLSGSGSTIYGVCRTAGEAESLATVLRKRLEADIFAVTSERRHGVL
jgi:4-diphosphocytidyl-2-C-methyl-D-erythritol kinase